MDYPDFFEVWLLKEQLSQLSSGAGPEIIHKLRDGFGKNK
jgi:hypothetical protein